MRKLHIPLNQINIPARPLVAIPRFFNSAPRVEADAAGEVELVRGDVVFWIGIELRG